MFLIQYEQGQFIDGEDIQWVNVKGGNVNFILKSAPDERLTVADEYQSSFVNSLEAINDSVTGSVEAARTSHGAP